MIPLRDTVRSRSFPIATVLIICLNTWVFLREVGAGDGLERLIRHWALFPGIYTRWTAFGSSILSPARYAPLLTSMFLHGGWAHLLGNMLYLWVFGGHVEDMLGHVRFLTFYLVCGFAAAMTQVLVDPLSMMPIIGASGAIAGVLGGYFFLFPRARIVTLIPLIIIPWFVEIPAIVFLGVWFLMQLLNGTAGLGVATESGGVAWWAHAGGFVTGFVLIILLPKNSPRRRMAPGY